MSNDIFWADVTNFICPYCHTLKRATVGLFGSDGRPHVWCDHCGRFTYMIVKNAVPPDTSITPRDTHCCIDHCSNAVNFMVVDTDTGETDAFCNTHWAQFIRNLSSRIEDVGE